MPLDSTERLNLAIAFGAVALGYATEGPVFATSLALGAGIESINFRALRSGTRRLFEGELAVGQTWIATFALRFLMLAVVIGVSLRAGAHPVGLLLGLSTIVPAVIVGAWRARPPIGNPEPGPPPDHPSWDAWNPWLARERDPQEPEEQ